MALRPIVEIDWGTTDTPEPADGCAGARVVGPLLSIAAQIGGEPVRTDPQMRIR